MRFPSLFDSLVYPGDIFTEPGVDPGLVRSATAVSPAGEAEDCGSHLARLWKVEEADSRAAAVSLAGVHAALSIHSQSVEIKKKSILLPPGVQRKTFRW